MATHLSLVRPIPSAPAWPPLALETRTHVGTAQAAFYLSRQAQTLREWSSTEAGAIRPLRIHGRLAWPVADIKRVLGLTE